MPSRPASGGPKGRSTAYRGLCCVPVNLLWVTRHLLGTSRAKRLLPLL